MYKAKLNLLYYYLLEEQPKQDSVQNNPSNIPELHTQPAENDHCQNARLTMRVKKTWKML